MSNYVNILTAGAIVPRPPAALSRQALAEGAFFMTVMEAFQARLTRDWLSGTSSDELTGLMAVAQREGFISRQVTIALETLALVQQNEDCHDRTTQESAAVKRDYGQLERDFDQLKTEKDETHAAFDAFRTDTQANHKTVCQSLEDSREEERKAKREIMRWKVNAELWHTAAVEAQKAREYDRRIFRPQPVNCNECPYHGIFPLAPTESNTQVPDDAN